MRPIGPLLLVCATAALAAPQPTTTTLSLTTAAPVYGRPATVRAAVNANLGSVAFTLDGTPAGAVTLDPHQQAAILDLWLTAGTHTIGASYDGGAGLKAGIYAPSNAAPLTAQVAKGPTAIQAFSSAVQVGQPWTLSVYVIGASSGIGPLTATVTASTTAKSSVSCAPVSARPGFYSCAGFFGDVGALPLTLNYSGDDNTLPSTLVTSVTVSKAMPGVYIAVSPDAPVYGDTERLGVLVMGAQNVAAPSGTVTFSEAGHTIAAVPVAADGHAILSGPFAVGSHPISAVYSGDGNYLSPRAVSATLTVAKAPTAVTISADPAPLAQPFNLYASVALSSGTGTPAGTVAFSANGKDIIPCVGLFLNMTADGVAHCNTSFPTLGTYTIAVRYGGDANTLPASATLAVTVRKASPGVYLSAAPANPVYGAPVTLGALALGAPGLASPTGNVTFSDSGRTVALQFLGPDGHASVVMPLAAGPHILGAAYSGDANYQSASASAVSLAVSRASTTTSLTALAGGPFTASINVVAPGAGTPTGLVQFWNGGAILATVPLGPQGPPFTAVLSSSAATGNITASYIGDVNFLGSSSDVVPISPVQTQLTVAPDANPSAAGQSVTFTVTLAVLPRLVAGTPTGSVTLTIDGTPAGAAAWIGTPIVFRASPSVGSHLVSAQYSGDTNYPVATAAITQIVNPAAATLSVTSNAPVAVYGQPVTLTARLSCGAAPFTACPASFIQFLESTTTLASAPLANGAATATVTLPAGAHNITASWPGDSTWAPAYAQTVQTVNKAAAIASLTYANGTLAASVVPAPPGAGVPTGILRFLDAASGAILASAPLAGGAASVPLPASADALAASYSGDDNFLATLSPTLNLLSVTNAASFHTGSVAPDEVVVFFGPDLAPATVISIRDSAGFFRTLTPLYAAPAQVSAVLPSDLAPGPATVTLTSAVRTLTLSITVASAAPGLFTADSTGHGAPAGQVLIVHSDGSLDPPRSASDPIDWSDPAASVYLVLYGTGIRHAASVVCTVAGAPAIVAFSGPQATDPGIDQLNILLPPSARVSGPVSLTLTADGQGSNPITLSIVTPALPYLR